MRIYAHRGGGVLCFSITTLLIVGCSQLSDGVREPNAAQQLLEQVIENLVFVVGGTFMLGDVGRPNGAPYVTLTDFSRPAVEVKVQRPISNNNKKCDPPSFGRDLVTGINIIQRDT
jgi:hypothetical protein